MLWLCGITAGVNDVWNEKSLLRVRRHSQHCKMFSLDAARKISEVSNVTPGSSSGKACSTRFGLHFFLVRSQVLIDHYRERCPCQMWRARCVHVMRLFPLKLVVKDGCSLAWEEVSCYFRVPNPYKLKPLYKTSFCRCPTFLLSPDSWAGWTETGRCYVELMPKWVLESFAVSWLLLPYVDKTWG